MSLYQLEYFLFLALAFISARYLPWRQISLLIFSYFFYWLWSPVFLILLVGSSLLNFLWGRILRRRPNAALLALGVGLNLTLLVFFKSFIPWFGEWLPSGVGGDSLLMPVGISFYTFQAVGYLIDVYRGYEDQPSLIEVALFLAFWPTILAGPICRLPEMLPQYRQLEPAGRPDRWRGLRRIVLGLFMKVVVADTLASGVPKGQGVEAGFDLIGSGVLGSLDVVLLCIGFGFQIYFDFAGYSHIAIGSAQLFGLRLRENFQAPFLAVTISDFWRRWHMSLSSWIRDYVFFPLAARRRQLWWRMLALVISMTLFGIWHGASLNFALWGLYHGLLLAGHRQLQQFWPRSAGRLPELLHSALSWVLTFGLVTAGWVLFRTSDLGQAAQLLQILLTAGAEPHLNTQFTWLVVAVAMATLLGGAAGRQLKSRLEEPAWDRLQIWLSPAYLTTALLLVIVFSDRSSPFAYVRF